MLLQTGRKAAPLESFSFAEEEDGAMMRRIVAIVGGAITGLIIGFLAPVVFVAACVWDGRMKWSALTDSESIPYIAVLLALGIINGAIGAWDGLRSDLFRLWPVAFAPALLFLYPACMWAQYPSDSKSWGGTLLAVAIVAPFIWVAGRVGQEVGVRGRKKQLEPSPAPN